MADTYEALQDWTELLTNALKNVCLMIWKVIAPSLLCQIIKFSLCLPKWVLVYQLWPSKKLAYHIVWQLWGYEAVSEWATERVLREDKTHNTTLTMSDPHIKMPNKP